MSNRVLQVATALFAIALAGCQTTDDENWVESDPSTPFNQAEVSCENQTANIDKVEDRPEYFVGCMGTLGWSPRPESDFYTPGDAPDPS